MEVVKASLDRFEGDFAVVYSDDGTKYDVPRIMTDAKAGSRLLLYLEEGQVVKIDVDEKATDDALERIRKKYDRVKRGDHLL